MTTDTVEVVSLGESMVMLVPSPLGPLEDARTATFAVGGAESNVAMHLARLGHRVSWTSRVGADPFGRKVVAAIEAAGVDCSAVIVDDRRPTGVYFKDPRGASTSVHYYRSSSAASAMDPYFVVEIAARIHPQLVHVSGITPALSPSCSAALDEVLASRVFGPAQISFDVNYRAGLWDVAEAAPALLRLAALSDIVFVGLDEAHTLWGCATADDVRRLLAQPRWLIVKDSSREAIEFDADDRRVEPAPVVDVVEPVGAGDAFAAGWLSGYLRGLTPAARLRTGHLLAGLVLSAPGDDVDLPPLARFTHAAGGSDHDER